MKRIKDAIKKVTGKEVKYIFSYKLTKGGFVDFGTGNETHSVRFEEIEKYL